MSESQIDAQVAIIIVNYNGSVFLSRSVAQALRSSESVEVVVVDNDSSDDSIESLRETVGDDERVKILTLRQNIGFGGAVNAGASVATAQYLLLLNPDCFVRERTIRELVTVMRTHPDAGVVGPLVFDTAGIEQRGARRDEPTPARAIGRTFGKGAGGKGGGYDLNNAPLPNDVTPVDAVSGSCLMVEAQLFNDLGGMDADFFLHCEDLDICRRVRDAGRAVLFVPHVSVVHVQGASGRNLTVEKHKHRSMIRYFTKHFAQETPLWQSVLLKSGVWARFGAISARSVIKPGEAVNDSVELERIDQLLHPPLDNAVVVTGATSFVAAPVIEQLVAQGRTVIAVSRRMPAKSTQGVRWVTFDYLNKIAPEEFCKVTTAIHLAPIWVLPDFVHRLVSLGVESLVAVGTSSVETKRASAWAPDRALVEKVSRAERAITDACAGGGVGSVIVHPAMVYDSEGRDQNVGRLTRFARRFRRLPIVLPATGLRQPVHADDLAQLCVASTSVQSDESLRFVVGGGERVSYREMLERIAASVSPAAKLQPVPGDVFKKMLNLAGSMPLGLDVNGSMIDRVKEDLVFSNDEAARRFGFSPRGFDPVARFPKGSS